MMFHKAEKAIISSSHVLSLDSFADDDIVSLNIHVVDVQSLRSTEGKACVVVSSLFHVQLTILLML